MALGLPLSYVGIGEREKEMMTLEINNTEYKVEFGFNSFCDTDLLDRTTELIKLFSGKSVKSDKDITGLEEIKKLFTCIRDLLYVGFEKNNPVKKVQDIGNLLDDYKNEEKDGKKRSALELFGLLTEELMNEGFLAELIAVMKAPEKSAEN